MGQVNVPSSGGISVVPIDRESGPGAGPGASGNRAIFLGANAGRNSTVSDFVVIGNNAAGVNNINNPQAYTSTGLNGSVNIGSRSFLNGLDATTDLLTGIAGSLINIGTGNFPNVQGGCRMAGTMAIGSGIGNLFTGDAGGGNYARNILVGDNIWQNNPNVGAGAGSSDNILIGYLAGASGGGRQQWLTSVVVGAQAGGCGASNQTITNCVIIGALAGSGLATSTSNNTIIGANAGTSLSGNGNNNNILIGSSCNMQPAPNGGNTLVGASTTILGSDNNTILGYSNTHVGAGSRCIVIGKMADNDLSGGVSDQFILGTFDSAVQRTLMYADMNAGNLVIGTSVNGTNRDFGGVASRNILKLINGIAGGTNPVGGGYFYVSAGALHWVGSSGTDTPVAPA